MTHTLKAYITKKYCILVISDSEANDFAVVVRNVKTLDVIRRRRFKKLKNAMRQATNIFNYFERNDKAKKNKV